MARKTISLNEELKAKSAGLFAKASSSKLSAESYREYASQAEQEAITAEQHAQAVVKALTILDEAGVVL